MGSGPNVVFVLGGPGAGKGTQCENIVKHMGFRHISAGDCLREECARADSEKGAMIKQYMVEGRIVPVKVTVDLMKDKMLAQGYSSSDNYLIDGFPRNLDNLEGWLEIMADVNVLFCLCLDVPEQTMLDRLCRRGEASGRCDDNLESAKKRLQVYRDETTPIIKYFEQLGKCKHVDGLGTKEEVWGRVSECFAA